MLDTIITFVLAGLATYRVSRMLAKERGMFGLFEKTRDWVFTHTGNGWLNEGVNCPFCLSFWVALIAAFVIELQMGYTPVGFVWLWLALSGFATFLLSQDKYL